jgi:hypothetical protein
MAGYQTIFSFLSVCVAVVLTAPVFAFFGFLIYRLKHRKGTRGALWGAAVPLLCGVIGLIPLVLTTFASLPYAVQSTGTQITMTVPVLSIPIGIIVLVGMAIFVKPNVPSANKAF